MEAHLKERVKKAEGVTERQERDRGCVEYGGGKRRDESMFYGGVGEGRRG